MGVHGLAALLLAGSLAASTPPRLAPGFDPCIHVDLVSLTSAPSRGNSSPAPAPAAQREKAKPSAPLAPAATAPRHEPTLAAAVPASPERRPPVSHDGTSAGDGAGIAAAPAPGRPAPIPSPSPGRHGEGTSPGAFDSLATPRYHDNPHPAYPHLARLRGHEGVVLLAVEVLPNGKVGRLQVKSSSGYALLDRSALAGLKKWSFEPGRKLGVPVAMWVDVPIRFHLE